MKKKIIVFIEIVLIAVIAFQGYRLYQNRQVEKQYEQKIEKVNNILNGNMKNSKKSENGYDVKSAVASLKKLKEQYKDVVALIDIPGTDIRYPVLQAKDNKYYLNHDINHKQNSYGEVFLDYRNSRDFTDGNSIVYGHNVESQGVIFNQLLKYKNQDFYNSHKNVYIVTDNGVKKFRVVSSYVADPYFSYRNTGFENEEEKEAFLKKIIGRSLIQPDLTGFEGGSTQISLKNSKTDLDMQKIKGILTLSTCEDDNHRMVVQCIADWR